MLYDLIRLFNIWSWLTFFGYPVVLRTENESNLVTKSRKVSSFREDPPLTLFEESVMMGAVQFQRR